MAIVIRKARRAPEPEPLVDENKADEALGKLIRRLAIRAARDDHEASLRR